MELAGLSYAVVSWWGNASSGRNGAVNNATLDLFKFLKGNDSNFKIAIMEDAYSDSLSNASYVRDFNYIYDNFVKPYGNWYFDWQGRPLLLFFSPLVPTYNDSRFTVRTIGNFNCRPADSCPEPDWIWWTAPTQFYQGESGTNVNYTNDLGNPVISSDGEVDVVPRIDSCSYHLGDPQARGGCLKFDSNLTLGLYQYEWNYVIQNRSQVKLVLIYSWNEYYERSEIEPHYEPSGTIPPLANETKCYVDQLEGDTQSCSSLPWFFVAIIVVIGVVLALVMVERKRHLDSTKSQREKVKPSEHGELRGKTELTADSQGRGDIRPMAKVEQGSMPERRIPYPMLLGAASCGVILITYGIELISSFTSPWGSPWENFLVSLAIPVLLFSTVGNSLIAYAIAKNRYGNAKGIGDYGAGTAVALVIIVFLFIALVFVAAAFGAASEP